MVGLPTQATEQASWCPSPPSSSSLWTCGSLTQMRSNGGTFFILLSSAMLLVLSPAAGTVPRCLVGTLFGYLLAELCSSSRTFGVALSPPSAHGVAQPYCVLQSVVLLGGGITLSPTAQPATPLLPNSQARRAVFSPSALRGSA